MKVYSIILNYINLNEIIFYSILNYSNLLDKICYLPGYIYEYDKH